MSKLIKVLFVFGIFCFAVNSQSFAQIEDDWQPRVMVQVDNNQPQQHATITNEFKAERNRQATIQSGANVVAVKPNNSNTFTMTAYLRFMLRFLFSNPFFMG